MNVVQLDQSMRLRSLQIVIRRKQSENLGHSSDP